MNNIYVESEFSNRCNDCPFYNIETEVEFVGYEKNYHKCLAGGDIITGNCPLKPLTDRLAEERKKVVQEIREKIRQDYPTIYFNLKEELFNSIDVLITMKKLTEILDQIERGE